MANGSDTEEYVVLSRVRPGLKREFAFAWKSQADCAGAVGRTRARRSVNGGMANEVSRNPINKRLKSSDSKNAKNDAEECSSAEYKLVSDAENTTDNVAAKTKTSSDVVVRDNAEVLVSVSVSEEEPKSGVVDLSSDDEQKSAFEPTSIELPEAEGQAQECDSGNEDGEQDESKPPCKGEEMSGLGLNREPHDGVVERAFDEMPVKRVALSAVKVAVVPLLRSATVDIKNRQVLESSTVGELGRKMLKQMELKRFPKFLKELLETGLLEGMSVRYLRGLKTRGPSDTGLRGIIKGSGILCSCDSCGGTQVVTPNQFELHAGSGNKRPPEYIYLDNGNTLRDVLNACKDAPLESLEVAIRNVIGCSVEHKLTFCMNCKGSIPKPGSGRTLLLCNSCMILTKSQPSPAPSSVNSERSPLSVSVSKSSYSGSSSSPRSKTQGRLTRKDLRLHKLVFQNDVLPEGTKLGYFAHGKQILAGCKMGFGIYCECCKSEVSPSQFEAHAGWASRRKPYLHIYLSVGVSLHQLSVALAKLRKPSTAENDDLCSICADGGDLICCDCCPRAFHTECVSLASVPNDTWYCKYCLNLFRKEKFVKLNANAVAAGRIAGINPLEQLIKRCTRIVETADPDIGGCALCRGHGFSKSEFGPQTVILCDQCEKEYHVGCLKEHEMGDLKELPEGKWFCCMDCGRIHSALETQVARGEENLQESLLTVKKKLQEKGSDSRADVDIRWRLLSGKMVSDETRPLFLKAVAIFHEQFDPIADSNVRGDDLIPPMVYGRSVKDQEFGGMYCAVLSVNSNIVSAGIIRIFGEEVAELPLVATSSECQGQGYFQALFSCIENLLRSLNVRNLVLPAAGEAESLWTNKFGFKKITEDEMMKYRKDHPLMVFQGTSMLHKSVLIPVNLIRGGPETT